MKLILFTLLVSQAGAQSLPLTYSTYFGGDGPDVITSIASDAVGNSYVCGFTYSSNLPVTPGAFQPKHAGVPGAVFSFNEPPSLPDAFVAKFSPSGSPIYVTYLGGKDYDSALSIAVDSAGNAIVAGQTRSVNFPVTPGALKAGFSGIGSMFVAKLNADGSDLIFATYFGGTDDSVTSIALDSAGNVYMTGRALSHDFPVTDGTLGHTASNGVFAAKLSADGSTLLYSAILGGNVNGSGTGIAVDATGNAYVAGFTSPAEFTVTTDAFQKISSADVAGFVAKLNADASAFLYSTLLGGSKDTFPLGRIALNAAGEVSLAGSTIATDFPVTAGAFQKTLAGEESAFVTKFNATLSELVFSTYLGGSGTSEGAGVAEDANGNVWMAGFTNLTDFPITTPELTRAFAGSPCISRGGSPFGNPPLAGPCFDPFAAKFDSTGKLLYSSTLSGSNMELVNDLSVDPFSALTVVGSTLSNDFPVSMDAFQYARFPADCRYVNSPSSMDIQPCADGFFAHLGGASAAEPPFTIVNRGGYLATPVAPNEIVSIFGLGIGPDTPVGLAISPPGSVSTELAGYRLLFDGAPAPLLYLSRNQINAIVPNIVPKARMSVVIQHDGATVAFSSVEARAFSPGIPLQGDGIRGQAAVINADGSLNGPSHPAKPGSVASLFVFGVNPSGRPGQITDAATPLTDVPLVVAGYRVAQTVYAGSSPGSVTALTQINFEVPDITGDALPIYVAIAGFTSPFGAFITVR